MFEWIKIFIIKYFAFVETVFEEMYNLIYLALDKIIKDKSPKSDISNRKDIFEENDDEDIKGIICECIMLVICIALLIILVKAYIYLVRVDYQKAYISNDIFTSSLL